MMNDILIIGFDYSNNKDETCLSVCRKLNNGSLEAIKIFYGDEAEKMYVDLAGRGVIGSFVNINDFRIEENGNYEK